MAGCLGRCCTGGAQAGESAHEAAELVEVEQPVAIGVVLPEDGGGLPRVDVEAGQGAQGGAQLAVVEAAAPVGVEAIEGRAHLAVTPPAASACARHRPGRGDGGDGAGAGVGGGAGADVV